MNITAVRPSRTYAPTRPPAGRPRRAAALMLVLAGLLVLTAGIALGRASAGRTSATRGGAPPAPAEAQIPRGRVDGVGIGWLRSRAGAVAAATGYLTGVSSRTYLADPAARQRIVAAIVTPAQISTVLAQLPATPSRTGGPYAAALAAPAASAWRYLPVGYRMTGYDAGRAAVDVWAVQITAAVGAASVPGTAAWGTTSVPLVWAGGDWKLDVAGMTGRAGPTPASDLNALSSDLDLVAADRTFTGYGHVAP